MNNKDILVILSTCPDAGTAEALGQTLVGESLAACVNVLPGMRSIPPREVPEVVALPVADGHHAYLSWVASSTRTPRT